MTLDFCARILFPLDVESYLAKYMFGFPAEMDIHKRIVGAVSQENWRVQE